MGIFLNSVLSGCLKLLIIVLTRSWAVLLTNYKWAVVNSIRIKKNSHILIGSEIFLSEISSQVKYNFKIKLYYVKIQRILRAQQVMKLKFSNSENNIFFKLITRLVHFL